MSNKNYILNLLNMEDKNINFSENFIENRKINNKRVIVVIGYLQNNFDNCPVCGSVNNNTIIKNGTKKSLIKIPKISELESYLELKKQKYKCKNCNKIFVSKTTIVNYRCHISNNTKYAIINYAKEMVTNLFISKQLNISNMTVQRTIDTIYNTDKLYKNYLPEAICIDEFTAFKKIMAFNICDAKTGKTIDLELDRTITNLEKYFSYYSLTARKKVKFVVMDMYKPYIGLINKMFPNTKIIIDRFHIVQLLTRSLNKTRIRVMKKDKLNYRKFKRYKNLLFKPRQELNFSYWNKYLFFKNLMTEVDAVDYLLKQNKELEKTYNAYQSLLYAIQRNDYELLEKIIKEENEEISDYMQTSIKTLREFKEYIKNTLEQPYSNGVMERNNNTCKLIKRIAFGYRNFKNFKAKILIITNIFRKKKGVLSLLNVYEPNIFNFLWVEKNYGI